MYTPNNEDKILFRQMIQNIKDKAPNRRSRGDYNSLLKNAEKYEKEFNQHPFDLEYKKKFFDVYVNDKFPCALIAVIFDRFKKHTGINISKYNREESRDKNLSILKSCKIYHDVYEKFQYFAFERIQGNLRKIPRDQNTPNETFDISDELEHFIVEQWKEIKTSTQVVHRNIFEKLLETNHKIYAVVMFQYYNQIFIMPFKRIQAMNALYEIMETTPISLPNTNLDSELMDPNAFFEPEENIFDIDPFFELNN